VQPLHLVYARGLSTEQGSAAHADVSCEHSATWHATLPRVDAWPSAEQGSAAYADVSYDSQVLVPRARRYELFLLRVST